MPNFTHTAAKAAARIGASARSAFAWMMSTVSFLRAYVAGRLTPVLGDERGEIASWVVQMWAPVKAASAG